MYIFFTFELVYFLASITRSSSPALARLTARSPHPLPHHSHQRRPRLPPRVLGFVLTLARKYSLTSTLFTPPSSPHHRPPPPLPSVIATIAHRLPYTFPNHHHIRDFGLRTP